MAFEGTADFVKDLAKTTKDFAQEMHERVTDGFVEIVVKGNLDYKTSMEKNQEASSRIVDAKVALKDVDAQARKQREQMEMHLLAYNQYLDSLQSDCLADWNTQVVRWGNIALERFTSERALSFSVISLSPSAELSSIIWDRVSLPQLHAPELSPEDASSSFAPSPLLTAFGIVPALVPVFKLVRIAESTIQKNKRVLNADENLGKAQNLQAQAEGQLRALEQLEVQFGKLLKCLNLTQRQLGSYAAQLRSILNRIELDSNGRLTESSRELACVATLIASAMVSLSSTLVAGPDQLESLWSDLNEVDRLVHEARQA